jgi:hypothetical protein
MRDGVRRGTSSVLDGVASLTLLSIASAIRGNLANRQSQRFAGLLQLAQLAARNRPRITSCKQSRSRRVKTKIAGSLSAAPFVAGESSGSSMAKVDSAYYLTRNKIMGACHGVNIVAVRISR